MAYPLANNTIIYKQIFSDFYLDEKFVNEELCFDGKNHSYIHVEKRGENTYCWIDQSLSPKDQSIQQFVKRLNEEKTFHKGFETTSYFNKNLKQLAYKINQHNHPTCKRQIYRLIYNIFCLFRYQFNRFSTVKYPTLDHPSIDPQSWWGPSKIYWNLNPTEKNWAKYVSKQDCKKISSACSNSKVHIQFFDLEHHGEQWASELSYELFPHQLVQVIQSKKILDNPTNFTFLEQTLNHLFSDEIDEDLLNSYLKTFLIQMNSIQLVNLIHYFQEQKKSSLTLKILDLIEKDLQEAIPDKEEKLEKICLYIETI